MQKRTTDHEPLARQEGLVVQQMPDEVLIYDLERHKAHCLNLTAARIWQHCDGRTSVAQIARKLTQEFQARVGEDVVYLALDQLGKDHLLASRVALPPQMKGVSRRELMRRVGLATAVALPIVISIMSPTAAHAVTCIASGATCSTTVVCCSTLATCTPPATCP
ncbi:MAG: PqqD family protein [Acidobacteria bacterium]|nr:PqqD family protein [Acidobacteriota bacterium]